MPIREYVTESGELVEVLHGAREVLIPSGWRKVISKASFSTGSVREETMSDKMKKGYHKAECANGSRFKSRFSVKSIKRAWGW